MLRRALIVDDSIPLHQLIKTTMDEEGLEFHSAYDGASGLSMTAALRPSLILLDVDMPDLDGFEVCRRLKANAETAAIPVIFLTADFQGRNKVSQLGFGAVDCCIKPFKPDELSARIRATLKAKQLLEQESVVDGLTGLWNGKYLTEHAAAQSLVANHRGEPLSCILLDVDGLRLINTKHGNSTGDEVLRSIGKILASHCRTEDAACRREGGKFAILMPATSRADAAVLAERLCVEIRQKLAIVREREASVRCSFGVADTLVAGEITLLERAETTLMRAKQNGGDCVSIARPLRKTPRSCVGTASAS